MARRFQKTPVVSEPYFAKGKKAKEGHSLLLVKLLPPPGPPLASGHTCPDPVSATGNLSSNPLDGLGQLQSRPLQSINFSRPAYVWESAGQITKEA